ncbi:hypothetical protein J6W34_07070 [bacterium]|nr:hypothetical protein [bacterium]
MKNRKEILDFIANLDNKGERIIDILLEVSRIYQLNVQDLPKLLNKEQKAKMTQQEAKLNNIKEN